MRSSSPPGDPSVGSTGSGSRPVRWGSESARASERPSPLKTATALYSFSCIDEDLDAVDVQVLVQEPDELLALLGGDAAGAAVGDVSLGVDRAEVVRMATSPSFSSNPMPVASSAPRPITYCNGLVAEEAEVAGAAAGTDAGCNTAMLRRRGRYGFGERIEVGRFGAVSSSVRPPGRCGRPPRPSWQRT